MIRKAMCILAGATLLAGCETQDATQAEASVRSSADPESVLVRTSDLVWSDLGLVPGVDIAVLSGNPAGPGHYVVRLRFPPDTRMPAHWHPAVEYATILSGTLLLAMGEVEDPDLLETHTAGTFMVVPARQAHYGRSVDEVVIELSGPGPYEVVFVDDADDPRIQ